MINEGAYVYAISVDGVVRYIGKGSGVPLKRANEHIRTAKRLIRRRDAGQKLWAPSLYNHLAKAISSGAIIKVEALCSDLSHEAAFSLEAIEIAARPVKQLWNLDSGGLGGKTFSAEHRRKLSEVGKKRASSPEERERRREWGRRSHTPERREQTRAMNARNATDPAWREARRQQQRERWKDPALAERMRVGLDKGRTQPRSPERMAKTWASPETRASYGAKMKRKWADPTFREKRLAEIRVRMSTEEGRAALVKMQAARWPREKREAQG